MLMTGASLRFPFDFDFPTCRHPSICPKPGGAHSPPWSGGATGVQVKTLKPNKQTKKTLNSTSLPGGLKQPGKSRPGRSSRKPQGDTDQGWRGPRSAPGGPPGSGLLAPLPLLLCPALREAGTVLGERGKPSKPSLASSHPLSTQRRCTQQSHRVCPPMPTPWVSVYTSRSSRSKTVLKTLKPYFKCNFFWNPPKLKETHWLTEQQVPVLETLPQKNMTGLRTTE